MSQERQKITSFEDLTSWQCARELLATVYKITANFPQTELYALTSRLRRAVVSVSSNLARGFSRATIADRTHFYIMSRGSLTKVQS